jgi:hypothetical protein
VSGILGLPIMAPNDIERKSDFPIREAEDKKIKK